MAAVELFQFESAASAVEVIVLFMPMGCEKGKAEVCMTGDFKLIVDEIVIREFGEKRNVLNIEQWGGGAHNICFKVIVDNPKQVIFVKIEKDKIFPRTRRYQMEREVYSNKLITASGVPCPEIICYSFEKRPVRYIIQEFIDGKLMGELMDEFTDQEKSRAAYNIRKVADSLLEIQSNTFGEVFAGGEIGLHATWKDMLAHVSRVLQEDAGELDIFTVDEMNAISLAHSSALKYICYRGNPSLVHGDLHEFNIFADNTTKTSIQKVFDFGFALFMASYASYYGPQAFAGNEKEISFISGVLPEELKAFDIIFSLEFVVFAASIQFAPDKPYGYIARKKKYVDKCRE